MIWIVEQERKREIKNDLSGFWPEQLEGQSCHFLKWKRLRGASFVWEVRQELSLTPVGFEMPIIQMELSTRLLNI